MDDQVKAPIWKPALIYGAILGLTGIFLSLVFYFLGMLAQGWVGWINFAITTALTVYLMILYRDNYLGGFASYGQIFVMVLLSGIVSTIIGSAFVYLLYDVIDPALIDQARIAAEEKIMGNSRIPENMYDTIFEKIEKNTTPAYMLKAGLIAGTLISAIIGLIIAAFVKKEETPMNA